jgi:hypothetical protein
LVSGYLSENQQKDLEWQGIIRALEDTELYGVLWRSSTKTELAKFMGGMAGGMAMSSFIPLPGVIMAARMAYKVGKEVIKHSKRDDDNPFWSAYNRAQEAGKVLA